MTNIVSFNPYAEQSQPTTVKTVPVSPIMFTAYERSLFYEGASSLNKYNNTGHKALIRIDAENNPVCLNVVKNSYKVVQNAELFDMINDELLLATSFESMASVQIQDRISYGGRTCMRQYVFPDIAVESPERDKICFRVIAVNGFGGSAVKLIAGAIDFFCTNGMIRGEYIRDYAKHTSGLSLQRFADLIKKAIDVFWKDRTFWSELRNKKALTDPQVLKWLEEQFGETLGAKLYRQYLIEQQARGGANLWALYSALTYYASHADGEFRLRETVNDHAAATLLKRENDVHKLLQGNKLLELAA